MELHRSVGVAGTTITAVAERAGVERKTVYRHFADEDTLAVACQAMFFEQHAPPDPRAWLKGRSVETRLASALTELYPFYRSTADMCTLLIRDATVSDIAARGVREMRAYQQAVAALVAGDDVRVGPGTSARVALGLVLEFETWQAMTDRHGLDDDGARAFAVSVVKASLDQ
jgi:AcrR family transcriptional regulator